MSEASANIETNLKKQKETLQVGLSRKKRYKTISTCFNSPIPILAKPPVSLGETQLSLDGPLTWVIDYSKSNLFVMASTNVAKVVTTSTL